MVTTMADTGARHTPGSSRGTPPVGFVLRPCARLLAALLAISPSGLLAADLKVVPSLTASETYSDNISLAPAGQEQGAFVTEVSPGVSIRSSGARVKFHLDYSLQALFRTGDTAGNTIYHQLAADANAELVKQTFFVDARANISQQNISLLGPLGVDTTTATGNITTVGTLSVSPYLRHRFGSFASTEVRYTHDEVHYVDGGSNSSGDGINLALNSGPAFNDVFWGANYSNRKAHYGAAPDTDFQNISGTVGYRLTRKFRVFATGGNESNSYQTIGSSTGGSFWSAGFGWTPSARTSLDASYGHRFFGATRSLSFSHRTRLTTWNAAYSQDVTSVRALELMPVTGFIVYTDPTTGQKFVQIDPATGRPLLSTFDIPYLTDETIIYKRLSGSVGIHTGKSMVSLSTYHTTQDQQLSGTSVNQYGGDASWNWRFAGRTTSTLSAGWSRIEMPASDRTDNLRYIRAILTRKFQPKVNGSVELRHQERDSNQPGSDYQENAIVARVYMTF